MFTKDLLYCNLTSPTYLDANETESVFETKAVYIFLVLTLIFMPGFVYLFFFRNFCKKLGVLALGQ